MSRCSHVFDATVERAERAEAMLEASNQLLDDERRRAERAEAERDVNWRGWKDAAAATDDAIKRAEVAEAQLVQVMSLNGWLPIEEATRRAERAEARVRELEGPFPTSAEAALLRRIAALEGALVWIQRLAAGTCDPIHDIARAALAEGEP